MRVWDDEVEMHLCGPKCVADGLYKLAQKYEYLPPGSKSTHEGKDHVGGYRKSGKN